MCESPGVQLAAVLRRWPLTGYLDLERGADIRRSRLSWIALGATKTGVVYRLKGNPPHAHE